MLDLIFRVLGIGMNGGHVSGESEETRVRLAASLLLIEAARMDPLFRAEGVGHIISNVLTTFSLPQKYIEELIAYAGTATMESSKLSGLVPQFNQVFSDQQRAVVAETAWSLIYTDEVLGKLESRLQSTLLSLLWLDDVEIRDARERAKKSRGYL